MEMYNLNFDQAEADTILCHGLVTDEMADCIVQLHCMTCCDANSGFYGKGKSWCMIEMNAAST